MIRRYLLLLGILAAAVYGGALLTNASVSSTGPDRDVSGLKFPHAKTQAR